MALEHARSGRVPVGLLYSEPDSVPMHERLRTAQQSSTAPVRSVEEMLDALAV